MNSQSTRRKRFNFPTVFSITARTPWSHRPNHGSSQDSSYMESMMSTFSTPVPTTRSFRLTRYTTPEEPLYRSFKIERASIVPNKSRDSKAKEGERYRKRIKMYVEGGANLEAQLNKQVSNFADKFYQGQQSRMKDWIKEFKETLEGNKRAQRSVYRKYPMLEKKRGNFVLRQQIDSLIVKNGLKIN